MDTYLHKITFKKHNALEIKNKNKALSLIKQREHP